MIMNWDAAL